MPETTTFDAQQVIVIWDGMVLTGLSDDCEITLTRNEDDVTPKTGIKGDTIYNLNANRSGALKLNLFSESASMTKLRRDAQERREANLTVRNANKLGAFIVSDDKCRILKVPDFAAGKEVKSGEVSFYIPVLVYN